MLPNITKSLPKKSKKSKKEQTFYCACCDFSTSKKGNWERHLATQKHLKKSLPNHYQKRAKKSQKVLKYLFVKIVTKNIRAIKVYGGTKKNVCNQI